MKRMRKTLILVGVAIVVCLANVNAAVLTFEDLDPGYETYAKLPAGYGGFNWNSSAYWITKYYHPGSGYDYGTIERVSAFTAGAQDISMSNGTFDFNGAYITAAWDATENVVVEGWQGGSKIYDTTIVTHNDAPYWFDFNWSDVDTVWFRPGGSHIAIDNITYNNIPEPTSLFLLGAGLLALARSARRRRIQES